MILVMAWAWLEDLGAEVQSSWNRISLLGWKISGVAGRCGAVDIALQSPWDRWQSRVAEEFGPRDECIDLYRRVRIAWNAKTVSAYCIHIHVHAFVAFPF